MIFGLPPSEVAVHPSDVNDVHMFFLMTDDVEAFIDGLDEHGIAFACTPVQDEGWGRLTEVTLPGGELGVYEPRHERPEPMSG